MITVVLVLVSLVDKTGVLVQERLGKVIMVDVLTKVVRMLTVAAVVAAAAKVLSGVMLRGMLEVTVA